jgi:hypothetical protein
MEDDLSSFNTAHMVDMYIKNVEGFGGEGEFLSKFNLQIRDNITFCVARRTFNDEVGNIEALSRPREGDLIYLPLNDKVFEIKFVEHEAIFYQMGSLQMYELQCELFEYSNERFNTGLSDIDSVYTPDYDLAVQSFKLYQERTVFELLDEEGFSLLTEGAGPGKEVEDDTDEFQREASEFIDFSVRDPFSEGAY